MFKLIQQDLSRIPAYQGQPNYTVHSLLQEFHAKFSTDKFSLKYVVEGTERYKINEQEVVLQTGQYLLSTGHKEGSVVIDSKKTVQGICIYLNPALLAEVSASFQKPNSAYPDISLDKFFTDDHFLTRQFYISQTHLGNFLKKLSIELNGNKLSASALTEEFYFRISELILEDYRLNIKQLQQIPSVKENTKFELLKKLETGKEMMNTHFTKSLKIEEIAKNAQLSAYHFYRLFKNLYGISPLQYLIKKRLELAQELLQKQNHSITEIGLEAGFTDIYSFSRIYKKHYGKTPSSTQTKNSRN